MKKFILIVSICLLAIILMGLNSAPVQTVPKSVTVFYGHPKEMQLKVLEKTREGYVVKSTAGYLEYQSGYGQVFIVMEKY